MRYKIILPKTETMQKMTPYQTKKSFCPRFSTGFLTLRGAFILIPVLCLGTVPWFFDQNIFAQNRTGNGFEQSNRYQNSSRTKIPVSRMQFGLSSENAPWADPTADFDQPSIGSIMSEFLLGHSTPEMISWRAEKMRRSLSVSTPVFNQNQAVQEPFRQANLNQPNLNQAELNSTDLSKNRTKTGIRQVQYSEQQVKPQSLVANSDKFANSGRSVQHSSGAVRNSAILNSETSNISALNAGTLNTSRLNAKNSSYSEGYRPVSRQKTSRMQFAFAPSGNQGEFSPTPPVGDVLKELLTGKQTAELTVWKYRNQQYQAETQNRIYQNREQEKELLLSQLYQAEQFRKQRQLNRPQTMNSEQNNIDRNIDFNENIGADRYAAQYPSLNPMPARKISGNMPGNASISGSRNINRSDNPMNSADDQVGQISQNNQINQRRQVNQNGQIGQFSQARNPIGNRSVGSAPVSQQEFEETLRRVQQIVQLHPVPLDSISSGFADKTASSASDFSFDEESDIPSGADVQNIADGAQSGNNQAVNNYPNNNQLVNNYSDNNYSGNSSGNRIVQTSGSMQIEKPRRSSDSRLLSPEQNSKQSNSKQFNTEYSNREYQQTSTVSENVRTEKNIQPVQLNESQKPSDLSNVERQKSGDDKKIQVFRPKTLEKTGARSTRSGSGSPQNLTQNSTQNSTQNLRQTSAQSSSQNANAKTDARALVDVPLDVVPIPASQGMTQLKKDAR